MRVLGQCFIGRRNPVPVRRPGKEWTAEDRQLTMDDFYKHFGGAHLLGGYVLDENDQTGVVVGDIDADGPLRGKLLDGDIIETNRFAHLGLAIGSAMSFVYGQGVMVTLTGGKGVHAIAAFPERRDSLPMRAMFRWGVANRLGLPPDRDQWQGLSGDWHLECYPRQDHRGGSLGNLIRLPFGVDPATNRRAMLCLGVYGKPVGPETMRDGCVYSSLMSYRSAIEGHVLADDWDFLARHLGDMQGAGHILWTGQQVIAAKPTWLTAVACAIALGYCYGAAPAMGLMADLEAAVKNEASEAAVSAP